MVKQSHRGEEQRHKQSTPLPASLRAPANPATLAFRFPCARGHAPRAPYDQNHTQCAPHKITAHRAHSPTTCYNGTRQENTPHAHAGENAMLDTINTDAAQDNARDLNSLFAGK